MKMHSVEAILQNYVPAQGAIATIQRHNRHPLKAKGQKQSHLINVSLWHQDHRAD
ncbi:MAG: hypothetical protein WBA57_05385 [Elainellaceae cyanobacterium]